MNGFDDVIKFRDVLRRLERVILSNIKDDSYCCGITTNQCHILLGLNDKSALPLSDLGNELQLDKATLSRTIDKLVKKEMVKRKVSTRDRRFQDLELTEKGKTFVLEINRASLKRYQSIYKNLEDEVRSRINGDLNTLLNSLLSENLPERGCCRIEEESK